MAMDFISEVRSAHLRVGCLELVSASSKSVLNAAHSNERVEFMELVSRSKAAATKRFNTARVFVAGGSGTLQVRYISGAVEHTVLNGYPDPIWFQVDGLKMKLLSFAVSDAGLADMRFSPSEARQATLYLLSDDIPTKEQALIIWKHFSELLGVHNLTVNLRASAWWDTPDYPIIPPFENPATIRYESYKNERWTNITSARRGVIYTVFGGKESSEILIKSIP
jgi:hypothetical protein